MKSRRPLDTEIEKFGPRTIRKSVQRTDPDRIARIRSSPSMVHRKSPNLHRPSDPVAAQSAMAKEARERSESVRLPRKLTLLNRLPIRQEEMSIRSQIGQFHSTCAGELLCCFQFMNNQGEMAASCTAVRRFVWVETSPCPRATGLASAAPRPPARRGTGPARARARRPPAAPPLARHTRSPGAATQGSDRPRLVMSGGGTASLA